jgi:ABC-type multidrug transport system fused ATPase/permease subunit
MSTFAHRGAFLRVADGGALSSHDRTDAGPSAMSDLSQSDASIREALRHIRWAFGVCRTTNPTLYAAFWLTALVGTVFPAGAALAVRGLVNAVNEGLSVAAAFNPEIVYLWLLLGLVTTVGTVVSGSATRYLARRFEVDLHSRLNLDILRHIDAMAFVRFEDPRFHDALRRAQESPEVHVARCLTFTLELLTKAIQVLSLMAILFVIEPTLFLLLIPVGIPYLLFHWRLSRRQFEEIDAQVKNQRWISYYTGVLSGVEHAAEIKLLGLAPLFIERCRVRMAAFRDLRAQYQRFEFFGNLIFALFSVIAIYIAMSRAAFSIVHGQLTIGDLAIYGSAAAQLRALVEGSVWLIGSLRWDILHIGSLRAFLVLPPGGPRRGAPLQTSLSGGVAFRNVTFTYPGAATPTLANVSFVIEPGETVALVGANGAGKTTIAKLIARLHDPTDGAVLFDGFDARDLDVGHLRRHVTCLFQQFGRYAASAADNIAFGDWEHLQGNDARIEAIARAAGVHDLIVALPQGYQTMLGRAFGQYEPSGGQWQQLAIARAIARDARILILDEPTANLDIDTEYRLFLRYRAVAEGRTILLISHRFSTVRMADRILVLDAGQVVERGSHDELMRLNGRYAALYDLHRRHLDANAALTSSQSTREDACSSNS